MTITQLIQQLDNGYHLEPQEVAEGIKQLKRYLVELEKRQTDPKKRLKYLRGEILAERISLSEIAELQNLVKYIEPDDILLLEWAGVPENVEARANRIANATSDHLTGSYGMEGTTL